ncbi:MAG: hypothetical protein CM15mP46_5190 [Alphaproteobacteria bacterium]|nr:MAG: hypothetical protein CM15mP46_5190 [Alphaproteobacteria bacterium]
MPLAVIWHLPTMEEVMQRADVSARAMQVIAAADGFTSLGLESPSGVVAGTPIGPPTPS